MFTTISLQYMVVKINTPIFLKCFSKFCFMQECVDFQRLLKDTQLPKMNSNNIQNHLNFFWTIHTIYAKSIRKCSYAKQNKTFVVILKCCHNLHMNFYKLQVFRSYFLNDFNLFYFNTLRDLFTLTFIMVLMMKQNIMYYINMLQRYVVQYVTYTN